MRIEFQIANPSIPRPPQALGVNESSTFDSSLLTTKINGLPTECCTICASAVRFSWFVESAVPNRSNKSPT